jgi:positive regulator of sigma E activity
VKVVEKARVLSVEGGNAQVAMKVDDSLKCSSCTMASACAKKERRFSVQAPEGVKAGDEVTVEMNAPSPAVAAILVFMVPLVVAFSAGGTAYWLTSSETLGLLGGLAGAAAVYLVIRCSRLGSKGVGRIVGDGGRHDARRQGRHGE